MPASSFLKNLCEFGKNLLPWDNKTSEAEVQSKKEEDANNEEVKEQICNLAEMDGPSFELEMSFTPVEKVVKDEVTQKDEKVDKQESPPKSVRDEKYPSMNDNVTKEEEKVDNQKSPPKARAKLKYVRRYNTRRGLPPTVKSTTKDTEEQVIVISSQEKEQPEPKKRGQVRKRGREPQQRRYNTRLNSDVKPPFKGTPFINEVAKIHVPFTEFVSVITAKYGEEFNEFDYIPFKLNNPDWNFDSDSIFVDSTFVNCSGKVPLPDKKWTYGHRDLVSDEVSNVLDCWVKKYFEEEIEEDDHPFLNTQSGLFFNIDQFRDLVFCQNTCGSEVWVIFMFLFIVSSCEYFIYW